MHHYKVELEVFEGPLDLLLHLIQKLEIDIYDIPMATLTEQYLEYLNQMKELEVNIASEYLVMASELLKIKSHMLLPMPKIIEEEIDPRETLMEQLLEYQNYKMYAENLKVLKDQQSHKFMKPPTEITESDNDTKSIDVSMHDLIRAYQMVRNRIIINQPNTYSVHREVVSREAAKDYLYSPFKKQTQVSMTDIFTFKESRQKVVAVFIIILEEIKNQRLSLLINNNEYIFERQYNDGKN